MLFKGWLQIQISFVKVAFISRDTLYKDPGGDTVQIENTARYLRALGVEVDVLLASSNIDYSRYDILHFFNIIRPADILTHIKKSKKPFVISTIYVDYTEYEKNHRKGFVGLLFKLLPSDLIEFVKVIARLLIKGDKIISPSYLLLGQKKAVKKIIQEAALLLPNSESEYRRLVTRYGIEKAFKVIPNAIDPNLFSHASLPLKEPKLVLCVGRIEGRKNQLNLIRALNNTEFKLLIIGSFASNQPAYQKYCRSAAASNIKFINNIAQEQLVSYYKEAKVHVLPSWFETTGLSSLEAAAMGCNIVITDKGDTREYFEDMAYYCDPSSPESIKSVVMLAASNPFNEALREKILREYIWPVTAAKTLEAYKLALQ
jgi:glycosyltransferase involved in cell wall biosynthesis